MHPPGFANWRDYVAARGMFDGLEATPVFYAGTKILGRPGLAILCATTFAAIMTGLVGNIVAASRLLYAMSRGLRRQSTPTQRSRTCQYTS